MTAMGYTVQYRLINNTTVEDWHPSEREALRQINDYYQKQDKPMPPRRVFPNGVFAIGVFVVIPDRFNDEDTFIDYPPPQPNTRWENGYIDANGMLVYVGDGTKAKPDVE
jgi:hypothetical protein